MPTLSSSSTDICSLRYNFSINLQGRLLCQGCSKLSILCDHNVASLHMHKAANGAAVDDRPDADASSDSDVCKRFDISAVCTIE